MISCQALQLVGCETAQLRIDFIKALYSSLYRLNCIHVPLLYMQRNLENGINGSVFQYCFSDVYIKHSKCLFLSSTCEAIIQYNALLLESLSDLSAHSLTQPDPDCHSLNISLFDSSRSLPLQSNVTEMDFKQSSSELAYRILRNLTEKK